MIDDDTLAAWQELGRDELCDAKDCAVLETTLDQALTEIRRLQEERNYALGKETDAKNELANRDYVEWRRAYDSDLGKRIEILSQNLAAHQAVLRELAEAFDRCESNRGAFSCHEPHDIRCPKSRADSPEKWLGVLSYITRNVGAAGGK